MYSYFSFHAWYDVYYARSFSFWLTHSLSLTCFFHKIKRFRLYFHSIHLIILTHLHLLMFLPNWSEFILFPYLWNAHANLLFSVSIVHLLSFTLNLLLYGANTNLAVTFRFSKSVQQLPLSLFPTIFSLYSFCPIRTHKFINLTFRFDLRPAW